LSEDLLSVLLIMIISHLKHQGKERTRCQKNSDTGDVAYIPLQIICKVVSLKIQCHQS